MPSSNWTMEQKVTKRVEMVARVFGCTLSGDFLPIQLIYGSKTKACSPKFEFPHSWDITCSNNHWANEKTMESYPKKITHILV